MPRFALHDAVLHNLGACNHRCLYPRATAEDIIVPAFTGDVSRRFAHYWLKIYCRWAIQEGLSQDQTLLVAVEHMFNDAYGWGGQFLKGATWEDLMRAFCRQYVTPNSSAIAKGLLLYFRHILSFCHGFGSSHCSNVSDDGEEESEGTKKETLRSENLPDH